MKVVVGWIDGGTVAGGFAESVARLTAYEASQRRLHTTLRVRSGPLLPEGRNILVQQFLDTGAEWLFTVDSDMVFADTAVEQLIATAEAEQVQMVGGLCFGINETIGQFPMLYKRFDGLAQALFDLPVGPVVDVDGTAAAFIVTHRDVFLDNRREGPHPWFHRREVPATNIHDGAVLGEDLSWCWWLRDRGVRIVVDLRVEAGHVKETVLNRDTYTSSE